MKNALLLIIIYHQNPPCQLETVKLYENGKKRADIVREYDLTPSALDRWIKNHQNTGSFKALDNRSEEEIELMRLRKELQQLRLENDILKQAALITGRNRGHS